MVVLGYIEGPFLVSRTGCALHHHKYMGHDHKYMGHETANRGLGYMLFNAHLCNQPYYDKVVVGPWVQLCTLLEVWVLRVGMSTWTQTSLYVEDRGLPSTDDPGA